MFSVELLPDLNITEIIELLQEKIAENDNCDIHSMKILTHPDLVTLEVYKSLSDLLNYIFTNNVVHICLFKFYDARPLYSKQWEYSYTALVGTVIYIDSVSSNVLCQYGNSIFRLLSSFYIHVDFIKLVESHFNYGCLEFTNQIKPKFNYMRINGYRKILYSNLPMYHLKL